MVAYFMDWLALFQVLAGDFVTTDDGTGISTLLAPAMVRTTWWSRRRSVSPTPVDSRTLRRLLPITKGSMSFGANAQIVGT